ncbi:MAG: hypothetical protein LBK73_02010 [Treponema sp.]|jgi:hypothetical protein|nr:hypothetical protein [Treponema sp.]
MTETRGGLEGLVADNVTALQDGAAYIAVGKPTAGTGFRYWRMEALYPKSASRRDFGDVRRLVNDDLNTILFKAYKSAWIGFDKNGGYKSARDVAMRIRAMYEAGRCRASHDDVDALMPVGLRAEYEAEMEKRRAFTRDMEALKKGGAG